MKHFLTALLYCALSWAVQAAPPLVDADGRPALLGTPVTRIVTLAPSLTELVYAAGVGEKLVGVSAWSDFPEQAKKLPVVADAAGIALEPLLALRPDLVLTWKSGTRETDVARLKSAGINVFAIDIRKLSDVPRALRDIGRLTGRIDPAESPETAARLFERQLARVREAQRGKPRVRAFFEMSAKPLMTVNRDHFIAEVMDACGGENVFADASQTVFTPSKEELLKRGADALFYARSPGSVRAFDADAYRGLNAVRDGRVYALTADYILRPGPRLLFAVEETCAALDQAREGSRLNQKAKP